MKRFLAAFLVLCMAFIINSVQVYGAQDDTQTMWEPEDGDEQVQEEAELPKTEEASESLPGKQQRNRQREKKLPDMKRPGPKKMQR